MLIPLSWIKEYVNIKIPFRDLAVKLSEAGLTVEKWEEKDGNIIFDPEVTPNRPDWLSVCGIAREIAAVTNEKLKSPAFAKATAGKKKSKINNPLPINIIPNYKIVPRITSVIIKGVTVKPSPEWLSKRIKQIGLRPINNLVDITNYVLWLYGGLLHVFDYDKIHGQQMTVTQAYGGEDFRSLDGIDYKLPKGSIIIKDANRIIDLLPLKGGENTASSNQTKNVLLHSVVVDPVITRRTSQSLGLRSDSSAVAERGLDPNSTPIAVKTAMQLILQCAGGEVASEIIDHKEKEFKPWVIKITHSQLEKVLGIKIEPKKVFDIFERLGLQTKTVIARSETTKQSRDCFASTRQDGSSLAMTNYSVTVPTFRNDLHIEEDLIEEVARIYGYNHFPKTLPASPVPTTPVAYARNYDLEYEVKQILSGFGYSEIYTYSLISEDQLIKLGIDPIKALRVDNPISRDYEYLRPNLFGNLLDAYKLNQANFADIKIYELGKRYLGETVDKAKEEYWLWAAISGEKFLEGKGSVELLLEKLGVNFNFRPVIKEDNHYWLDAGISAQIEDKHGHYLGVIGLVTQATLAKFAIKGKVTVFALNYNLLEKLVKPHKKFQPLPKYPAIIEDLSINVSKNVLYADLVTAIKETSPLIKTVDLLDLQENSKTFRLTYLDPSKNLTSEEVGKIREKIIKRVKQEFGAELKS